MKELNLKANHNVFGDDYVVYEDMKELNLKANHNADINAPVITEVG